MKGVPGALVTSPLGEGRGDQERRKSLQDPQKSPQDTPQTTQNDQKSNQDTPKTIQNRPKTQTTEDNNTTQRYGI